MQELNKKRISVYTRSGEIAPAGYYRILQYVKKMEDIDLKVRALLTDSQFESYLRIEKKNIYIKLLVELFAYLIMVSRVLFFLTCDIFRKPDFVILSRVFIPRVMPFFFRPIISIILKKAQLIWDYDDHILENKQISESVFLFLSKKSTKILVIHDYLKSLVSLEYEHKVILLPTTDGDTEVLDNRSEIECNRRALFEKEIHMVWTATSGNLPELRKIIQILDKTACELELLYQKKLILNVVCNLPLRDKVEYLVVNNIRWTRKAAIQTMIESHIGIMPLSDTVFSKGKGGFKIIQYMSVGLPVLASAVGFNRDIIDENSGFLIIDSDTYEMWKTNILNISETWDIWSNLSIGSYQRWQQRYSFEHNYKIWEHLLEVNKY
jgi:glycosyltransferase involved in cell wall biosynthesis